MKFQVLICFGLIASSTVSFGGDVSLENTSTLCPGNTGSEFRLLSLKVDGQQLIGIPGWRIPKGQELQITDVEVTMDYTVTNTLPEGNWELQLIAQNLSIAATHSVAVRTSASSNRSDSGRTTVHNFISGPRLSDQVALCLSPIVGSPQRMKAGTVIVRGHLATLPAEAPHP